MVPAFGRIVLTTELQLGPFVLPQLPDTDASNWETHVVASGAVSGLLQTSFRAELTAVAHAVKFEQTGKCRSANLGRLPSGC